MFQLCILNFQGKKTSLEACIFSMKPIVVMTSKTGLRQSFSLRYRCLFFANVVYFCEQTVFNFPIDSLRSHLHIAAHTDDSIPLEGISVTF